MAGAVRAKPFTRRPERSRKEAVSREEEGGSAARRLAVRRPSRKDEDGVALWFSAMADMARPNEAVFSLPLMPLATSSGVARVTSKRNSMAIRECARATCGQGRSADFEASVQTGLLIFLS